LLAQKEEIITRSYTLENIYNLQLEGFLEKYNIEKLINYVRDFTFMIKQKLLLIIVLIFLSSCKLQNKSEVELDTEDVNYMFVEIKEDYPDYNEILNGISNCNHYCINNAGIEVVIQDSKVYCKCAIPTGI